MSDAGLDFTEDAFLGGQLVLRQPKAGHRVGHDALLLAAGCDARSGQRVVEFGTGVGAAGLALAKRVGDIDLTLVEIRPDLAALARHNAVVNGVSAQVCVLDVTAPSAAFAAVGLSPDSVDTVLMNPPFNDSLRHRASPDPERAHAHTAQPELLAGWVAAARRILKPRGVLTLIWRADGLPGVLTAVDHGFGSVVILPVYGDPEKPAIRILLRALKGGKAPMQLLPPCVLNGTPNSRAGDLSDVLAGRGLLPLALA